MCLRKRIIAANIAAADAAAIDVPGNRFYSWAKSLANEKRNFHTHTLSQVQVYIRWQLQQFIIPTEICSHCCVDPIGVVVCRNLGHFMRTFTGQCQMDERMHVTNPRYIPLRTQSLLFVITYFLQR